MYSKLQKLLNNEVLMIKDLVEFINHKDENIRVAIIENPNVSESILRILSEDMSDLVKKAIAGHYKTPPSVLDFLAKNSTDETVLKEIAWNENSKPDTLNYLYNLNIKKINAGLALNKNSSEDLLHLIALTSNTFLKKYVAENTSTSAETLDVLAREINTNLIKIEVAKNSSTSEQTLFYLASLNDLDINYALKTNNNSTTKILDFIEKFENQ